MKTATVLWTFGAALAAATLTGACDSSTQASADRGGNEMRSRATGERNERLGNDPAEQNTGRGSVPDDRTRQ